MRVKVAKIAKDRHQKIKIATSQCVKSGDLGDLLEIPAKNVAILTPINIATVKSGDLDRRVVSDLACTC